MTADRRDPRDGRRRIVLRLGGGIADWLEAEAVRRNCGRERIVEMALTHMRGSVAEAEADA